MGGRNQENSSMPAVWIDSSCAAPVLDQFRPVEQTSLSGWYVWGCWQTSSRRRSGKGPTLLFVATKIFTKSSFLSLSIQTNHALWHEEAAEYLSFSAISCSFLYPLNGYMWGGRVTLQTLRENTWSWMDRNSVGVFCVYLQKLKWQGTFHLHPLELLQDGRYLMQLDAMVEQMHEALLDKSVWPWNLIFIMVLVQQIYWLYIIPRIHQVISCLQKLLPCSNFVWQALSTTSDEVFDLQSDTAPYSCIQMCGFLHPNFMSLMLLADGNSSSGSRLGT